MPHKYLPATGYFPPIDQAEVPDLRISSSQHAEEGLLPERNTASQRMVSSLFLKLLDAKGNQDAIQ